MHDFTNYYMLIAVAVRERANCMGRKVGAIIVKNNRIISTGYNGTPERMKNCEDGGCVRCEKYREAGNFYDKCICVHAEQNAIITAARFGHGIEGATIYTTLQPCFSCLKESLQAKIKTIYYIDALNDKTAETDEEKDFREQYKIIESIFEEKPKQITGKLVVKDMLQYINQESSI